MRYSAVQCGRGGSFLCQNLLADGGSLLPNGEERNCPVSCSCFVSVQPFGPRSRSCVSPLKTPHRSLWHSQKVKVSIRGAGVWKRAAQCQVLVCLRKNDDLGRSNFQVSARLQGKKDARHNTRERSQPCHDAELHFLFQGRVRRG